MCKYRVDVCVLRKCPPAPNHFIDKKQVVAAVKRSETPTSRPRREKGCLIVCIMGAGVVGVRGLHPADASWE